MQDTGTTELPSFTYEEEKGIRVEGHQNESEHALRPNTAGTVIEAPQSEKENPEEINGKDRGFHTQADEKEEFVSFPEKTDSTPRHMKGVPLSHDQEDAQIQVGEAILQSSDGHDDMIPLPDVSRNSMEMPSDVPASTPKRQLLTHSREEEEGIPVSTSAPQVSSGEKQEPPTLQQSFVKQANEFKPENISEPVSAGSFDKADVSGEPLTDSSKEVHENGSDSGSGRFEPVLNPLETRQPIQAPPQEDAFQREEDGEAFNTDSYSPVSTGISDAERLPTQDFAQRQPGKPMGDDFTGSNAVDPAFADMKASEYSVKADTERSGTLKLPEEKIVAENGEPQNPGFREANKSADNSGERETAEVERPKNYDAPSKQHSPKQKPSAAPLSGGEPQETAGSGAVMQSNPPPSKKKSPKSGEMLTIKAKASHQQVRVKGSTVAQERISIPSGKNEVSPQNGKTNKRGSKKAKGGK